MSAACSHPNSSTPVSPAAIARQDARIARVGAHFTRGNRAIDNIMASLTPPVASPSCGDLLNSRGMVARSPFPNPGHGPSPTVELMTPAQLTAWYNSWAASSKAAAAAANPGAMTMPIVGGPSAGVSTRVGNGLSGYGLGDSQASSPGETAECTDPTVLPLQTVRPAGGVPSRIPPVSPVVPAAASSGLNWWEWGILALLAAVAVDAMSDDKKDHEGRKKKG